MSNTTPLPGFERGRNKKHGNPDFTGMVETRHLIVGRAFTLLDRAVRMADPRMVSEENEQAQPMTPPAEKSVSVPLQGVLTHTVEAPQAQQSISESHSVEKIAQLAAARDAIDDIHGESDDVDLSGLPGYGDEAEDYEELKDAA